MQPRNVRIITHHNVHLNLNNGRSKLADFLTPCDLDDSSFGQCLSKNLQNAFVEWKDGLPGTNTLGAFDPLVLKTLTITQANPNNVIQLKSNMKNVHMSGASKLIVKRAR